MAEKIEKIPKKNIPEGRATPELEQTPEQLPTPERSVERVSERASLEQEGVVAPELTEGASPQTVTTVVPDERTVRLRQIENILSDGLEEAYREMEDSRKKQFKEKGEETARQVNALLTEAKVKVKKIVDLIREWLKLIPGVNTYFLEQEAKIKTDRLLKLGADRETAENKNKM